MDLKLIEKTKGIWKETSYSTLLYFLLLLILVGLISSYLFGSIVCKLVYGISFISSPLSVLDLYDSDMINAMKTMQLFNALGAFVFPPLVFLHLRGLSIPKYLKLDKSIAKFSLLKIFILSLAMIPVANYLGALNESFPLPEFLNFLQIAEIQSLVLTEQFLIMNSLFDLGLMILIMGVVAAVGEELLFRGILQNLFQDWSNSKHLGVWLTAFLFSVIHLQYHAVLPRFALGAFIGYVYMYSGRLRISIYLHFFYNTSLVVLTYLIQHELVSDSWEFIGTVNTMVLTFASAILFSLSYSLFKLDSPTI